MIFRVTHHNNDACQTTAIFENIATDARDARWNYDTRQTDAIRERRTANARYATIRRNHAVLASENQCLALGFNQTVPFRMIFRVTSFNGNAFQISAIVKCQNINARHILGDCDACQATATIEYISAHALQAIRENDTR